MEKKVETKEEQMLSDGSVAPGKPAVGSTCHGPKVLFTRSQMKTES